MYCCITGCLNTSKNNTNKLKRIKFYHFPTNSTHFPWLCDKRQKWINAVKKHIKHLNDWHPSKYTTICSAHFIGNQKSENPLNPSYMPTIFPGENDYPKKLIKKIQRCERLRRMQRAEFVNRPGTEQEQSPSLKTETQDNGPRLAGAPQFSSDSQLPSSSSRPRGTQFPCAPITVTSGPSLQYLVSMPSDPTPAFPPPMIVDLKNEEDIIEPYVEIPSEERVISFDENLLAFQSYNDQPTIDLVPLSAHPVPLSNAPDPLSNMPDPLCDFQIKKEEENGTEEKENGAGVEENGTTAEVDGTMLELDGTMLELDGTVLELDGTMLEVDGTILEMPGTVKEENKTVQVNPVQVNTGQMNTGQVNPVEVTRRVEGQPMPAMLPSMVNLVQARAYEQKIKNLTRRCQQFGIKVRNLGKLVRRREAKINELQAQLETLCDFVREHHGGQALELITGSGDVISKQRYREIIKRRDDMIAALQNEVESLRGGGKGNDENENGGSIVTPRITIHSVKRDEQKKQINRQLLSVKREDRQKPSVSRRKKVQSTSDTHVKEDILQKSLVGVLDTSDILQNTLDAVKQTSENGKKKQVSKPQKRTRSQKSVSTKPKIVVQENPPVVVQSMPDISQIPSVSAKLTQKSSAVQDTSVPLIGNKRKSDIRQNPSVVIHPKLDIRQKSPDIPLSSVGLQRTSDIRQNALVIQIDGMHSTVVQPKLVRLDDDKMDLG